MKLRGLGTGVFVGLMAAGLARGQWDSGSDGSDGVFNPVASIEIDLGTAMTGTWDTTPGGDVNSDGIADGVYDPVQWAVVFKYSSITIPAGVGVTFKNHPSGAPVVWLSQGNVTIDGTVNLDGKSVTAPSAIQFFAEGGPGGWAGGQRGYVGMSAGNSVGQGPGGTNNSAGLGNCSGAGLPASHVTRPPIAQVTTAISKVYDNTLIYASPLHGGSGGTASGNAASEAGGGGGGAILIACGDDDLPGIETMSLGGTLVVRALGGSGAASTPNEYGGGGGSGGTIRLRAEQLSVAAGCSLNVNSGYRSNACDITRDATGRVEIEYDIVTNGLPSITGSALIYQSVAYPIFPPTPPTVRIVSIDGVPAPVDPLSGILTTDVSIDNSAPVSVLVQGENLNDTLADETVQVRVTPARGGVYTANATLTESGGIWSGAATLTFLPGRFEVQVRWPVPP